jgi:DNA mismatch repair ATPase MutS
LKEYNQTDFNEKALKIELHFIENIIVMDPQTVLDLELLLNTQTKTSQNSIFSIFKCSTAGGERLLRYLVFT